MLIVLYNIFFVFNSSIIQNDKMLTLQAQYANENYLLTSSNTTILPIVISNNKKVTLVLYCALTLV